MQTKKRVHNFVNLKGNRFGRLLVLSESSERRNGACWLCMCDCGNEFVASASSLRNGGTKSCGCLRRETSKMIGETVNRRHGKKGTRVYRIWAGMLNRCRNENAKDFARYGGSGVTVCKRWDTFENFLADMGEPDSGLTIERKENSKGYSKSNCVWATPTEQARNRKNNVILTFNGESLCISEWAERLGVNKCLISKRLARGWSIERTLGTPTMSQFAR